MRIHGWHVEDETEFGPFDEWGAACGPAELVLDRQPGDIAIHVWAGPAGMHLFWPDALNSRPDWKWGSDHPVERETTP